jgi:ATP-binding cassette, subfamily B, bacterial
MKQRSRILSKLRSLTANAAFALRVAFQYDAANTIGLIVSAALMALFPLFSTLVWRGLVNVVADPASRNMSAAVGWTQLLIFATLAEIIVRQTDSYFNTTLKLNLTVRINVETLKHAATLDLSYFEDPDFQDHLSRSSANIGLNIGLFISNFVDLIQQIVQTISLSILLATIDPFVFFVIGPLVVPYLWYSWQIAKRRF